MFLETNTTMCTHSEVLSQLRDVLFLIDELNENLIGKSSI